MRIRNRSTAIGLAEPHPTPMSSVQIPSARSGTGNGRTGAAGRKGAPLEGRGGRVATYEKKKSLSRTVYLAVLATGALLAVRWLLGLALVASAPGVVDTGTLDIACDVTGRVEAVVASEGMQVDAGQVLARIAVPGGADRARLSAARHDRLLRQVQAERARAATRGRRDRALLRARVAELRDRALESEAELAELDATVSGLADQIAEIETRIAALDDLERQAMRGANTYVDLRVQRLDLVTRRAAAMSRIGVLRGRVDEMRRDVALLEAQADAAQDDALESSQVAFLEAEAAQAEAELRLAEAAAEVVLTAPERGVVTWVRRRAGEVVAVGEPMFEFVPERVATVLVYPGNDLSGFGEGSRVRIRAGDVEAQGTVVVASIAHRRRPESLLRPYERVRVGPLVRVRVDEIHSGSLRAGAEVTVSHAALSPLHWLGF